MLPCIIQAASERFADFRIFSSAASGAMAVPYTSCSHSNPIPVCQCKTRNSARYPLMYQHLQSFLFSIRLAFLRPECLLVLVFLSLPVSVGGSFSLTAGSFSALCFFPWEPQRVVHLQRGMFPGSIRLVVTGQAEEGLFELVPDVLWGEKSHRSNAS